MGHSHIGPSRSKPGSRDLVILMLYREDKVHDLVASLVTLTFKLSARLSARCALVLHLQKVERARGRGTEPLVTPSGILDFEYVGYSSARDLEIPSIPPASRAKAEQIHQ